MQAWHSLWYWKGKKETNNILFTGKWQEKIYFKGGAG